MRSMKVADILARIGKAWPTSDRTAFSGCIAVLARIRKTMGGIAVTIEATRGLEG